MMSNEEFLRRLEAALTGRVPQEELDDAMSYHREYFAEAGENATSEIPAPEEVAQQIIRDRDEYLRKGRLRLALPAVACVFGAALLCVAIFAGRVFGVRLRLFDWGHSAQPVDVVQSVTVAEATPGSGEGGVAIWDDMDRLAGSVALEPFESITIEEVMGNVTITAGDEFTLFTEHDERETLSCFQDDGVLHITGKTSGILSAGAVKAQIVVTVPSWTELSLVRVKTQMGDIYLADIDRIGEVDLQTELGDIHVNGGDHVSLRCQSDLGNISLSSVGSETLKCLCEAGSIEAIEFSAKEATLQADLGSITAMPLGTREQYELDLSVDLGRVSVDGQQRLNHYVTGGSDYLLIARADAGNITLDFISE